MQASLNALIGKWVLDMGTGYKGNAAHYHSIVENLPEMENSYPYQNGFFGTRGNSKRGSIRHIGSDDPQRTAKEFYDKLTFGGKEEPIYDRQGNEHGRKTTLSDGSIISWRNVSHSPDKSPAVDINIERSSNSGGIRQQKIHFIKEN